MGEQLDQTAGHPYDLLGRRHPTRAADSHRQQHASGGRGEFNDSVTGSATVDNVAAGNATTGSGIASFLLGTPSSFVQQNTGPGFYPSLRQTRLFFFAQDAWHVGRKLTLLTVSAMKITCRRSRHSREAPEPSILRRARWWWPESATYRGTWASSRIISALPRGSASPTNSLRTR